MSDEHHTPDDLMNPDDRSLGIALGTAIRGRVEAPTTRPPVTYIAERAAAQARARNTRRAVLSVAAAAALVAGGISAWNALDNGQTTELIVVDEPTVTADPAPTAVLDEEPPETIQDLPPTEAETSIGPATPESLSTGPVLGWTEFEPTSVFGPDVVDVHNIMSVGDGRVLVQAYGPDGNRVLVTDNGADWTVIPMPPDFVPERFDIAGNRWLVTGWDATSLENSAEAFFSDNQGATWTDLTLDINGDDETSHVAAAMVSGQNMVIGVESRVHADIAAVIVSRGLVPDKESIQGWMSVEGNTVSFTRDDSSAPESFELTAEEHGFLYGGDQSFVRLYSSNGGAVELVAEYPAWDMAGYGAADGFLLTVLATEGNLQVTSPDGRQWSQTPLDDGFRFFTYYGSTEDTVWTSGQTGSQYRTERFEGVYTPPLVAELPSGIARVDRFSVGPAGVTVVAVPGSFPDADLMPTFQVAKDGYELRYNLPEGGITLWDVAADVAVYEFDAETVASNNPPAGVREVEGGDGPDLLVFEDPDTGEDLVAFTMNELEPWIDDPNFLATTDIRPEQLEAWVGWSADGTDWGWQTLSDAFGLTDLTDLEKEFTNIEVAVGNDFVLARVQAYQADPSDSSSDNGLMLAGQSPRWFFAAMP